MKDLSDFFSRADRTLFHYTGIGSLLGIVESRSVFASHAYYLNDAREIIHATSVVSSVLTAYDKSSSADFHQQFALWLQSLWKDTYGVFIFSLSEEGSLLSQWRSYTPHGKGVSLGFSQEILNAILEHGGFRLAKCVYDLEEQKELALSLIKKMFLSFEQRQEQLDVTGLRFDQRYYKFLEEYRGELLQTLAVMKHPSFSEEREWRIVSSYISSFRSTELCFREGASMLMPYIKIKFPEAHQGDVFDQVILGPSQDQKLSFSALSSFLSNKGVCRRTTNCAIPYRKW